jgi:hypothetical protein
MSIIETVSELEVGLCHFFQSDDGLLRIGKRERRFRRR